MARKRTFPSHLFSAPEIEVGAPLPARSHEFAITRGYAPASVSGGGRGAGPRLYDASGLAVWGVASALYWGGLEVLPAAGLAKALIGHFEFLYGSTPSRIHELAISFAEKDKTLLALLPDSDPQSGQMDAALLHENILRKCSEYKKGLRINDDLYTHVIDRKYVFLGNPTTFGPSFILFIDGWERGGEITLIDPINIDFNEASALEVKANEALKRPIGRLEMNVSLAIREAHDRIYDFRNNCS